MNGDITGVTTKDGGVTGVITGDGEVTGVTTDDGGITGVTPHHETETTGATLNENEAPIAGTEGYPGTPGVDHGGTIATEPGRNGDDNPPPLGPPKSDNDSDSDDDDATGDVMGLRPIIVRYQMMRYTIQIP
jgi:hypothetical protein